MILTVPEAAKRLGKNPETIRRWIREGKLAAHKVGTQHVIEEADLLEHEGDADVMDPVALRAKTFWGGPMPDWAKAVRESRDSH